MFTGKIKIHYDINNGETCSLCKPIWRRGNNFIKLEFDHTHTQSEEGSEVLSSNEFWDLIT